MRIAINGLGRIGKLVLRNFLNKNLHKKLILINEKNGSISENAHLIKYDSIHGIWDKNIEIHAEEIKFKNKKIKFTNSSTIENIPLRKNKIDLVIDCTGSFKKFDNISQYFKEGVKKVLISAPVHDDRALNLVYGINSYLLKNSNLDIITGASCTTNCLAPIIKVIEENLGIIRGSITTIHNSTNSQTILDNPGTDIRRSRSAFNSLIPTSTGSARAISLIYPNLKGKLDGYAVRVPVLNSSLTDCVFDLKKSTNREEVNNYFKKASKTYLKGILDFEEKPLVSNDFVNNPNSAIIDGISTMVINKKMLKVYAWYDNEWAYSLRLIDLVEMIIEKYK